MEIADEKLTALMKDYVEYVEDKQTARAAGVKWAMFRLGIATEQDIHKVLSNSEAKKVRKLKRGN